MALDDACLELHPGERLGLVGENGAGKSSLMNVLYGLYQPDAGTLEFDGSPVRFSSPQAALARGIGMVHQHFHLVPTLTVAQNVALGHEPRKLGLFDESAAAALVATTCQRLGFALDPNARVGNLSVGAQQRVEIVKALSRGVHTLILDEPTAVLTPQETDDLFSALTSLSQTGCTLVLITHKLTDVLRFSTRIIVMRRGRAVAEYAPDQASPDALAQAMVGEEPLRGLERRAPVPRGEEVLRVENLSGAGVHDVSFSVHQHEIVGLAGIDDNGQQSLARMLAGLAPFSSGTVRLGGKAFTSLSPAVAKDLGIAHIAEDRLRDALAAELSVEENLSLGRHAQAPFARGALIDFARRRETALALIHASDVRPPDATLRAGVLSGGNQQKAVLARELSTHPRLLVAVQPTRGLDVVATRAAHQRLRLAADAGAAVLLVSLDLDELLALSDRVLAMRLGKITGEFHGPTAQARLIGAAMLGVTG